MEIYTLNSYGDLDRVVEGVTSFIWTERYNKFGDFKLTIPANSYSRRLFENEMRLIQSDSDRVMRVDVIVETMDERGAQQLEVSGRSLEAQLLDRVARSNSTTYPYKWTTSRTPAIFCRNVYREICYEGARSARDIFTDIEIDETVKPNTITEPSEVVKFEFEPTSVYKILNETCDAYDLGMSVTRDHTDGQLTFRIFKGYDRTSIQDVNPSVLFSLGLDNLKSTDSLVASTDNCNVVWAYSEQGASYVYAPGVEPTAVRSTNRREHVLKVDKLEGDPSEAEILAHLTAKAVEYMALHRTIRAFEGEVAETSPYKYGVDYGLGDLISFHNSNGDMSVMMVSEQIFAMDGEGVRSYPTLIMKDFINAGSWLTWDTISVWSTFASDPLTWSELPE